MSEKNKNRCLYALIVVVGVALDQLVKGWALAVLPGEVGGTIPLIQDVFHFTYVENRGAAFGLMQNMQWLFLVVTCVFVAAMLWYLMVKPVPPKMPGVLWAGLLCGGAGNLIDRIARGFVVDMFDFRLINFYVFNVADCFVVLSVMGLMIYLIRAEIHEKREKKEGFHAAETNDNEA